jgi:hypothetical protein
VGEVGRVEPFQAGVEELGKGGLGKEEGMLVVVGAMQFLEFLLQEGLVEVEAVFIVDKLLE